MKLVFSESTVLKFNGKWVNITKGTSLLLTPGKGAVVDEDAEIILNNERYYLEAGDHITLGEETLTETLYGYQTNIGSKQPIDKLINYLDVNFLDWNINDPKFKQAVLTFFGFVPTDDQWAALLDTSSQNPRLREHLKALTASQIGADDEISMRKVAANMQTGGETDEEGEEETDEEGEEETGDVDS